ncbi:universal stress protein [Nonomuraea soli]|uniref:Nucleotide-binding universal stress UspA family protein n=1 Tax=Nonomuraea soli TaxID=1032476 RepID=A0A7W0CFI4_9ACTN|nr:universal stress protein [Nonomuraea soli]MBA2890045.1 nucleotide-binding universal stress UspA family protein [Nonomuraea soli]
MNRHIIVGTDGSPAATDAVRWAATEAARTGRPLHIVHVSGVWAYDLPTRNALSTIEELRHHEGAILAEAARVARKEADVEVTTAVVWGKVNIALQRASAKADLLVVGTHGHSWTASLRIGSTAASIAAHAACPVVVVPGFVHEPHEEIVVGFDEDTSGALDYAFAEASRRGVRLRAIHAWQPPAFSPFIAGWPPMYQGVFDAAKERARRMLQPWRDRYPHVELIEETVCGSAAAALRGASARADLLVVGSRKAFLGSVTNAVLHHARCPVAVVQHAKVHAVSAP